MVPSSALPLRRVRGSQMVRDDRDVKRSLLEMGAEELGELFKRDHIYTIV